MENANIKMDILLSNCRPNIRLLKPSQKLIKAYQYLTELDITGGKLYLKPTTKKKAYNDTLSFFEKHFKLHKILYYDEKDNFNKMQSTNKLSLDELIIFFNKLGQLINPFELPTKYIDYNEFYAEIVFFNDWPNIDKLLKKVPRLFLGIFLSSKITNITCPSYVHELTHTQIDSIRGTSLNYYNSEILPIFLELLSSYETDPSGKSLLTTDFFRHSLLIECIKQVIYPNNQSYEEKLINNSYIISTLKAYKLFDIYYKNSKELKEFIIKYIQNIFDGKNNIEQLLNYLNITYDNCLTKKNITKMFTR